MAGAVHVFIDGRELTGYTNLNVTRSKEDLTGQLNLTLFMGWVPNEAVLGDIIRGSEITVYIAGSVAFAGVVDRRTDKGSVASNIGAEEYTVTVTARGRNKNLVDSTHQHDTGTMLEPTNKEVVEALIKPFGTVLDWQATVVDLNRVRFRSGGRVIDELQRIAERTGLHMHETREGKLRVTDEPSSTLGDALVLGQNILSFSAEQLGDIERSDIHVKGQLTSKDTWGAASLLETFKKATDASATYNAPIVVQLFGDATPDLIERRTNYEVNKRAKKSRKVNVDVFHVQQESGEAWDIGDTHFVHIPPAGISTTMEIIGLKYAVDGKSTLKTSITLAPVIGKTAAAQTGLAAVTGGAAPSASIAQLGMSLLAKSWDAPTLETFVDVVADAETFLDSVASGGLLPPLTLPPGFTTKDT